MTHRFHRTINVEPVFRPGFSPKSGVGAEEDSGKMSAYHFFIFFGGVALGIGLMSLPYLTGF